MTEKKSKDIPTGEMDFLSEILLNGQELEIDFSSYRSKNFRVSGTLKIKEQDIWVKPKRGVINSPKAEAWMCTHPKYWKILCGLEPADIKTNAKVAGMLVRAGLYELSEMMFRRVDVMMSTYLADDLEWLMPVMPVIEEENTDE